MSDLKHLSGKELKEARNQCQQTIADKQQQVKKLQQQISGQQARLMRINKLLEQKLRAVGWQNCYQCDRLAPWLAPDSRCAKCTRLTPEEVRGDAREDDDG